VTVTVTSEANPKVELFKRLRRETGHGFVHIKKAMADAKDNYDEAKRLLLLSAGPARPNPDGNKSGTVASYIHDGRIGALLVLDCETDFTAKTPEFRELAQKLAMQITGVEPIDTVSFLEQPYIRDTKFKVKDLINEATAKFNEQISIGKWSRYEIKTKFKAV
jgi:translation elongation factor EF-Ts